MRSGSANEWPANRTRHTGEEHHKKPRDIHTLESSPDDWLVEASEHFVDAALALLRVEVAQQAAQTGAGDGLARVYAAVHQVLDNIELQSLQVLPARVLGGTVSGALW